MAKKNEKPEKQSEQQPTSQSPTLAKPIELTDEKLGQVVGGWSGGGGAGDSPMEHVTVRPDPTLIEYSGMAA